MARQVFLKLLAAAGLFLIGTAPSAAQVGTVDPNSVAQEAQREEAEAGAWESDYQPVDAGAQEGEENPAASDEDDPGSAGEESSDAPSDASQRASDAVTGRTVPRKDVFAAAEGVFGKGAEGLADLIEDVLRKQGEPSAYISGREAGGAFVVGARYGSGTLHHGIEGDRAVYWTGPSIGFDFGADANKVFVLVYNLHDSQRIFRRYPAAEGNAYVVGGFTASYLRRGDVVLIPVRMGVGLRLGVNAGYMRFSEKNRWLPF
jgi:hypothetical protein